jgi:hypothetical protein
MKNILIFRKNSIVLFITILLLFSIISKGTSTPESGHYQSIKNGWYEATVSYYNPNTFRSSSYILDVKVEYNRVVQIDFGNGGSIHSGYNNSGYIYGGGNLSLQRDYSGNILGATTKVIVTYNNGTLITYNIELE